MATISWDSGNQNLGGTYSGSKNLNTNQTFPAGSTLTIYTTERDYVVSFEDKESSSTANIYYGDATGSTSSKVSWVPWLDDGGELYLPNKATSYTITTTRACSQFTTSYTNPGGVVNIRCRFTLSYTSYSVTLNRNNTSAGSVSGAGTYTSGANCSAKATTNSGYRFIGWYSGNTLKSYDTTYTFKVSADTTLEARWVKTYTVSANSNNESYGIVKSGTGTYDTGTSVTLVAERKTMGYFVG